MKEKALDEARRYNEELLSSSIQLTDPFKAKKTDGETLFYNNILSLEGSGIMGYVKIPCISVNLPIYHGTSAEVLERGSDIWPHHHFRSEEKYPCSADRTYRA